MEPTVDLDFRESLRERAALAYIDRQREREAYISAIAVRELRDLIGDGFDIEVASVAWGVPTSTVEAETDGLKFRVQVTTKEVKSTEKASNAGMEWEETTVEVGVYRNGTSYPVDSLAEVGAVFKSVPLPGDEIPTPEPEKAPVLAQNAGLAKP